ncbi:hypothetical protein DPMN_178766 [Dreissena polymorpha]|uniref:Uncharacterized protein n=1 Tax=Dreissena polymorpha TaxID=45954 RepID=A0A9D4EEW6_DREPO|nr:hypothetical protein DPMN_178766 [Dreissena polymorpha]
MKLAEGLSIEDVSEDDDYEDDVTDSILNADYESLDVETIKESSPFTIVFSKVVEVVDAKTIKSPECVMKRDVVFKCFETNLGRWRRSAPCSRIRRARMLRTSVSGGDPHHVQEFEEQL